ncbi:MAG: exo-alpha-sialidase [Bacteroidota bacterium]
MNIFYFIFLFFFHPIAIAFSIPLTSPLPDGKQKNEKAEATNIVFKSADGGQTWQDISDGLPDNSEDGPMSDGVFANEGGLYLRAGNQIYHSKPNSTAPFWEEAIFPGESSTTTAGQNGIAYHYDGHFLQKSNGTSVWSPVYTSFKRRNLNAVFETAGGTVFIGTNDGLFRSVDKGKNWKQVYTRGWGTKLVESNGVLMATSQNGILRSTDDGENWDCVLYEGGVAIALERIKGGFATINYNTLSMTRRVRTSFDDGKTWQAIDAGLPANLSMASIIQVGENFFCGHPDGIYRSSDMGKTWKLLLPSVEGKVFNLSVSGNVIYAIPRNGGC